MKIFDFHFNPKKERNKIFNSFIYEPENTYERRVGNLYIIGELRNALPQNRLFLNKIADEIKNSYYKISSIQSLEESLRESLEAANNFLNQQEKEDNVSWLGNLSLAAFNLKNLNISFSKIGEIKIFLLRGEKIIDLSNELEAKGIASDSKNFSNIVSGNLSPSDKLIILTQSVFDLISENNLLLDLFSIFAKEINLKQADKEVKKILNNKKRLLEKLSGVFLLIELEKPEKEISKIKRPISYKESFLTTMFFPLNSIWNQRILNKFSNINFSFLKKLTLPERIKKFTLLKRGISKTHFTSKFPKLPSFSLLQEKLRPENINFKQSIILILVFLIVIGLGNQLFKIRKEKEIERVEAEIHNIQNKINEANIALSYQNEKKANYLYQEAWEDILSLSQDEKIPLREDVMEIKSSVKEKLFNINKIEEIISPEPFFKIELEDISPQKLIINKGNFFIANQEFNKIWQVKDGKLLLLSDKEEFSLIKNFNDYLLLFSPSNKTSFLKGDKMINKTISIPYSDPNIVDISSFGLNIYLIDQNTGEIIRASFKEERETLEGTYWLAKEAEKLLSPKSMAIDGSIWIIDENNSIKKYYKGKLEKEIEIEIFPSFNQLSKISTYLNIHYLYLLDLEENRIIILDKDGEIKKQLIFREDKLLDFYLTENENIIYILTSRGIYEIDINL